MKYEGTAADAPQHIRAAAERLYGEPLPDQAMLELDSEKRPGWMRIDVDVRNAASDPIDIPITFK